MHVIWILFSVSISRVVIQNERYEDWAEASLMLLRRLYFTYKKDVLNYHHKLLQESGISTDSIPEAYLSQASQGNFLEVLNMALNGKYKIFLVMNSVLFVYSLISLKNNNFYYFINMFLFLTQSC